jgi:hypothetical protein
MRTYGMSTQCKIKKKLKTKTKDKRTKNKEQRTKNKEQRTKNKEQRTKNKEQRTKNLLLGAGAGEGCRRGEWGLQLSAGPEPRLEHSLVRHSFPVRI